MTEGSLFPTFCHIGEYDLSGYRMLHRMLAMSQPLILWGGRRWIPRRRSRR
jgi:hypothetical protein